MTCHFFGPESAIFTGYAAARLLGAGSAEVPCPGRSEYAWGTARAQTGVPVLMCRPARYRPEREPEPVLLQAESRETESYAPDVKFEVAAPLRSRADLESSWYCGCSGTSRLFLMPETTSQTGGSGVSLLQVPCATNTLRLAGDAGQLSHAL